MINWYFSKHGDNTTISEDCQNILTFTILIINFFYKHRKSLSNMAIIYAVKPSGFSVFCACLCMHVSRAYAFIGRFHIICIDPCLNEKRLLK